MPPLIFMHEHNIIPDEDQPRKGDGVAVVLGILLIALSTVTTILVIGSIWVLL